MAAPYATDPAKSRGRLFVEEPSAHRTAFQRDRDRIIHSTAFRRLKHKTQVFVEHEGDYFRTRLTHSIEVAQVARTIASTLRLNNELTEAVSLAHDLGHTPFGHTGEDALSECMEPYGGFDHNAQAIKIVTSMEKKYAEFDGLNLSWECLEGIAKHNGPVEGPLPFALAEYNARHDLELDTHAGAEAQVAAISDDLAYNNHDLDDALRAGLFDDDQLASLPLLGAAYAEVDAKYPGLELPRRRHEALRRVFGRMVEDVIGESERRLAALKPQRVEDIRNHHAPVVWFTDEMWDHIRQIRVFLFSHMYRAPRVVRMRKMTADVVRALFRRFMEKPDLMPRDWYEDAYGTEEHRARIIADYIAGMTDRYALDEYERLTGVDCRAVDGYIEVAFDKGTP